MTTVSGVIRNRDGDIFLPQTDAALVSGLSTVATSGSYTDLNNKPTLATVATSGSYNDLSNKPDLTGFITNSVNNLTNYYLKTETYTQTEIQNLIGAINQFSYQIAASTSAVSTPASNVLYLIGPTGSGADKYEEYVYANSTWTKIGDTSVDLSGYVTTTALNTALADYALSSTIPTALSDLTDDSTHRTVTDTEKGQWMPRIYIGTCGTSAGTVNKIVTVESFPLDGNGKPLVGTMIGVKFTNTNSATAPKLNVNETGASSIWYNSDTASSTSANYGGSAARYCFYVWDGTYWVWVTHGTDNNDNTLAYNVRYNSASKTTIDKFVRYRILFTSADDAHWVPANTSTSTNATASRTVNQTPINPFGQIVYYGSTTAISAGGTPGASVLYTQYALTFGYSFNRTGAALTLTTKAPVYIKCAPQSNGSAIIDSDTPYVQSLPSTEDGKMYIYLGVASSATAVEMSIVHPVYYYKDGEIRLWTNSQEIQNTPIKYDVGDFDTADWSVLENVNLGDLIMSHGGGKPEAWTVSNIEVDGSDISVEITALHGNAIFYCSIFKENGVWAFDSSSYKRIFCENEQNKITEITSSATHVQYPSAKAVWDAVSTKYTKPSGGIPASDLASGVIPTVPTISTNISTDASSDTMTASPKAVKTYVDGAIPTDAIKYTQQSLTDAQKLQARQNIAADALIVPLIFTESGLTTNTTYQEAAAAGNANKNIYLALFGTYFAVTVIEVTNESVVLGAHMIYEDVGFEGYVFKIRIFSNGDPAEVTFTQQTIGSYSKPSGGIPASDLASGVIPSVPVTDVTVGGTSVVSNNVAAIPAIPAAQVNSDWNASSGVAQILNKPTLQQVYSGDVPDPSTWLDVVNAGDIVYFSMGSFYIVTHIQRGSGAGDTNYRVELGAIDTSGSGISVGGAVATKSNNTWSFASKSSNVDTIILTTQTAGGMLPNVMYNLGTLTGTVTFSLASPTDNTIVNHYYWTFTAGSTAPTITWPSGITWASGSAPIVTAGDYYEISVYNGIAMFMNVTPSS